MKATEAPIAPPNPADMITAELESESRQLLWRLYTMELVQRVPLPADFFQEWDAIEARRLVLGLELAQRERFTIHPN